MANLREVPQEGQEKTMPAPPQPQITQLAGSPDLEVFRVMDSLLMSSRDMSDQDAKRRIESCCATALEMVVHPPMLVTP